jgi:hypothetical protein
VGCAVSLYYHGPEYGYVDSNDREELDAIVRGQDERHRARRIESRLGRELTWQESNRLRDTRNARDRLAERVRPHHRRTPTR